MTVTTVIICIDGLDPEYLEICETPTMKEIERSGFLKIGRGMMPSVTNVNNVSILTGTYPKSHGIASNYRLLRNTMREIFVESSEYIQAETIFQRAEAMGLESILVSSKDKLRSLLGNGATMAMSSEQPIDWVVKLIGPPPPIYSLEINGWSIKAASVMMSNQSADIVYITTTDYAMHTYEPESKESQRHMTIIDRAICDLIDEHPDTTVLITADHGMRSKTQLVDLKSTLSKYGIASNPIPIIKDRYVVHHSNLGGCMYVYLKGGDIFLAVDVLRETPGVDDVLLREEAAHKYDLPCDWIGDLVVTGGPDVVFGVSGGQVLPQNLRSHGSTYELQVPILGYNGDFDDFLFNENRDVGRYVFERVLN